MSLIHHPDCPGGDNGTYKPTTEAYRIIRDFIKNYYEPKDDDTKEEIARYVFRSFKSDDIKESLCSFTIIIDNHLSLVWDSVLTMHYGQPIDRKGTGNGTGSISIMLITIPIREMAHPKEG